MENDRAPTAKPVKAVDPLAAALEPAVKVGATCGAVGFLFGSTAGIIRGAPPVLFGFASAVRFVALGTTFSIFRSAILHAWTVDGKYPVPRDMTQASAIAGGLSGSIVALVFRGRSNVIPGAVMFTIFGATGQHISNRWTAPKEPQAKAQNFWERMGKKSWTPFKVLSNDEYAHMLRERMLKMDVEIAILDDKIIALKEQQQIEEQAKTTGFQPAANR